MLFVATVIAALDYTSRARNLEDVLTHTTVTSDGRCDCIAVWVDYDLSPAAVNLHVTESESESAGQREVGSFGTNLESRDLNKILRQWDEEKEDFPSHLKLNLKFFPTPIQVQESVSVLVTTTYFTLGESDFNYDFKLT